MGSHLNVSPTGTHDQVHAGSCNGALFPSGCSRGQMMLPILALLRHIDADMSSSRCKTPHCARALVAGLLGRVPGEKASVDTVLAAGAPGRVRERDAQPGRAGHQASQVSGPVHLFAASHFQLTRAMAEPHGNSPTTTSCPSRTQDDGHLAPCALEMQHGLRALIWHHAL